MEEMEDKYIQMITDTYIKPWLQIKHALNIEFMTASDVKRELGITKTQLSHWDKKGMKMTESKPVGRGWRRFSIIDLFGFALIQKLRKLGVALDNCKSLINTLRHSVNDSPHFIFRFSMGIAIISVIDLESKELKYQLLYGVYDSNKILMSLRDMKDSVIILPLSPLLREILKIIKIEKFYVEFVDDHLGNKNKVVYLVENEAFQFSIDEVQELIKKGHVPPFMKDDGTGENH